MSSELPRISGKQAIAAFNKAGFEVVRIKGSHHIMKKACHRFRLSIPVHAGETLGVGLLASQIEAAGLTLQEFISLL
jgi:predicted RNA binding protein YcfA (HicA-like mRNA interferase family)